MRKMILAVCLAGMALQARAESEWLNLRSPGKKIEVSVFETQGVLCYAVEREGQTVLESSRLGLTVDGVELGSGVSLAGEPEVRKLEQEYPVFGHHAVAGGKAVEATLPLESAGVRFGLVVRVYDDGVGVRYLLPDGVRRIDGEHTAWQFPDGVGRVAWAEYEPGYERLAHVTRLDALPADDYVAGPVAVELGAAYVAFTEADCETFPDMAFLRSGRTFRAAFPASPDGWDAVRPSGSPGGVLDGTYRGRPASPWRCMVVAGDLTGLVCSDLLTNLCPAPEEGRDFSWVEPGRCLWQWWSVGAPRYEDQKAWYDAAAALTWEYYLIDDGWRGWRSGEKDQWALLEEAIQYGKRVGVKTLVWVDSKEMREAASRRAYLERVKDAGAAGIKIDFIPAATSSIMQWYMGAMQDCAELGLLLNFHGSVKPTGLGRTYPNDITREAVRGNEWQILRYNRVLPQSHYVALPFTRLLAGPADITPVTLNPRELATGGYSWAHEFAQAIVFLSPVTHFSDHYSFYLDSPFRDLLADVPTTWDDTRVLRCTELGEVVAFARRKAGEWWIGVMNGDQKREVEIPLDFIGRKAEAVLLFDDEDEAACVRREERTVSRRDVLKVRLRAGGGFVARISR